MNSQPRCDKHRDRTLLPACPTCNRIAVEYRIVKRTVGALLEAGFTLNVFNGGDENELPDPTDKRPALLAVLGATDDEYLMVFSKPEPETEYLNRGWVRFVYGNDGWDVISDYTTNLEGVLKPVLDYADSISD